MTELPLAPPALRAEFLDWLRRFSAMVRDVDYAAARPLFHPHTLAFGTHATSFRTARHGSRASGTMSGQRRAISPSTSKAPR